MSAVRVSERKKEDCRHSGKLKTLHHDRASSSGDLHGLYAHRITAKVNGVTHDPNYLLDIIRTALRARRRRASSSGDLHGLYAHRITAKVNGVTHDPNY